MLRNKFINSIKSIQLLSTRTIIHTNRMITIRYANFCTNTNTTNSNKPIQQFIHQQNNQNNYHSSSPHKSSQFQTTTITLHQLIKSTNNKAIPKQQTTQIQNKIINLLTNIVQYIQDPQNRQQLNKKYTFLLLTINTICLTNFKKMIIKSNKKNHILSLIQNNNIINYLLFIYKSTTLKDRSLILNFIYEYHKFNIQANTKLQIQQQPSLEGQTIDSIIYYLNDLVKYTSICTHKTKQQILTPDFLSKSLQIIYNKIMLASPKMLFILTKTLNTLHHDLNIKIQCTLLLSAVEEHTKGLIMIQSKNVIDWIYLLQTLGNLIPPQKQPDNNIQLRTQLTNKIYQQIKSIYIDSEVPQQTKSPNDDQYPDTQQPSPTQQPLPKQHQNHPNLQTNKIKLRLLDINILLDLMLKLSAIDTQLFILLEKEFLDGVNITNYQNISAHLLVRNKIVMAVMNNMKNNYMETTVEKLRIIKQQHIKFIMNLGEKLLCNEALKPSQIAKLIQLCQQIAVKSRKVKRMLQQMIEKGINNNTISNEEKAYIQIVINGF